MCNKNFDYWSRYIAKNAPFEVYSQYYQGGYELAIRAVNVRWLKWGVYTHLIISYYMI